MACICFLGSGNMAEAIIAGILEAGVFQKEDILAADVNRERLSVLQLKYGIGTTLNRGEDLRRADTLVLSVKPQNITQAIQTALPFLKEDILFASILAGTRIQTLETLLQGGFPAPRLARIMPNLAAFVRQGLSAVSFNAAATDTDKLLVTAIFESIGQVQVVEETLLDAVTAVTGSGPAYVFYFLECFQAAAVRAGIPDDLAPLFCLQTLKGAVELLEKKKTDPAEFRRKVTSPGGTTEAALRVLTERGMESLLIDAVQAALKRSLELGR